MIGLENMVVRTCRGYQDRLHIENKELNAKVTLVFRNCGTKILWFN